MCKLIGRLIDPSILGVQVFPKNVKDLAIATQNAHVTCYDNLRGFKSEMGDMLCIASTGGSISNRALYTDSEQSINYLHAAIVLNGIHSFVTQPDLAQRCLTIHTKHLPESGRKSERAMEKEFEEDLPMIFRGLLDLVSSVFKHLPGVEITNPERMMDFVHWLAAMEKVRGAPTGIYQIQYSTVLQESQLDTLLENLLAAAIIDFAQEHMKSNEWSGTPTELLEELCGIVSYGTMRSPDWPRNPIILSKRLRPLSASLLGQGISVEFTRGKKRTITLKKLDH